MLTYTFSRREKTLILAFAIVLVIIAWYMLVFQSTTDQINQLESEIAVAEEETAIASAKVSQMSYMQEVIEQRKAEGVKPVPVPEYDNMQPLMARLDSVMSKANTYQLSFGALDTESSNYILRPVAITFSCDSYDTAESVIASLANGPYPCVVDSVSITDGSYRSSGSSATSCAVHVTFLEKR